MSKEILKKSERFFARILQDAKMVCKPKKKEESATKKSIWRVSQFSENHGQQSRIITAYSNKKEFKRMKLKNAVKKGFPVVELGQVYADKAGVVHFPNEV